MEAPDLVSLVKDSTINSRKGKIPGLRRATRRFLFAIVSPTIVVLGAIGIFPLIYSLYISLHNYRLSNPTQIPFIGLVNYWDLMTKLDDFWIPLANTFYFVAGSASLELIIGFLLALALSKNIKGKAFFRACLVVPMAVTPAVVGLIFKFLLSDFGIISKVTSLLGMGQQNWLAEPSMAMPVVIAIDIWAWTPLVMLILSAGLDNLPKEPLEAAQIDGASKVQTLLYITIPLLKPIILVAVLMRVMETLKIFDMLWVLTFGGPGTSTEVLSMHIYRIGFKFLEMGRASALSYLLLVVTIAVTTAITRRLIRKDSSQRS
jgi:multiple sugar transport system permease protein